MVDLHGAKERRLLAALALHPGQVVSEGRLIEALWGDAPPRTAGKTLQNHVLRLRRSTRPCAELAVVTRSPGYLFTGETDVVAAERAVARAREVERVGGHEAALALLDDALARWRGPSLEEFADLPFARGEAARLEELRETIREDRVSVLLSLGRHHEAVTESETLVDRCPLRERRWNQLMLALYRDGRQAEALAAYHRLRGVLADQLGVEPGPEVRATEAAILRQDAGLRPTGHRRAAVPDRGPMPCVGRTRELRSLLAHVDGLRAGRGAVVLVCGEAGIGKSRLLAELAGSNSVTVLRGRCLEGAGARPFHPFAEALGPAVLAPATGGDRLRADEVRARVFDGVVRHVVDLARTVPVALLLDDLHWADADTAALLRHLTRSTVDVPVLVAGAYREHDVDADHPLDAALAAMRTETECTVLRLGGIDVTAMTDLLGAIAGARPSNDLAAAITAETGGNPFFAREIARHLGETGAVTAGADGRLRADLAGTGTPDGARQVVARRRRRLSAAANRLLDTAAAIEGPFPWEPVRSVAGVAADEALTALDEVLAAGLVVVGTEPDRYDFTHALIRHAVYEALNPSRRLRLHRALGEAMVEARGAGLGPGVGAGAGAGAAEVAVQFHRAVPLAGVDAGVAPALEAAEQARCAGAHDEQAAFLRIALELLPAGDGRRAALAVQRAVALAWSLRFDDAVAVAREVLAGEQADPCWRVTAAADVATVLATAGSNRHAWALAPIGLRAAGEDADPGSRAALTVLDLDRREADDPAHPGMPLDLPGRRAALEVLHRSGRLAGRGDLARYAVAAIYGRRERIPAEAADDPSVATYLVGDYVTGAARFAEEADAAQARGQLAWEVYCRSSAGRALVALGEFAEAAREIARSASLVDRLPGLGLGWQLLHHQGAEDALTMARDTGWAERLAAFRPWMEPGPERHWGSAAIDGIGARIHARRGDGPAASRLLSKPVHALQRAPAWAPNYGRTACELAETLWLLDRRDHLAIVEAALRDKALPADFRFPMTDARLALARLCALDGRPQEAGQWFAEARRVLEDQGARPLRAVVDHDEALMHHRRGDRAAARPFAHAARVAFAELGMPGWSHRLGAISG
ncbi:hypothetical protein Acsp06_63450 [Actinomycetospora sp. NBRC 106375]|nr:hypothetical protein Acsp06_63450 [Actinomycetospora sp. NBRC 106375]